MNKLSKFAIKLTLLSILFLSIPSSVQAQGFSGYLNTFGQNLRSAAQRIFLKIPGDKPGTMVLKEALYATEKLETFSAKTNLDAKVLRAGEELLTTDLTVTGPVKIFDLYQPQATQQDINLAGQIKTVNSERDINIDYKSNGQTSYFRFNEVPPLPFLPLETVKGQWLMFDQTVPAGFGEEDTDLGKTQVSAQDLAKIKAAFNQLLAEAEVSSAKKEDFDGHSVFALEVTISDEALLAYFQRLAEIKQSEQALTEANLERTKKYLAASSEFKLDLKVDRNSFFVRQIMMPLMVDYTQFSSGGPDMARLGGPELGVIDQADQIDLNLTITAGDFNQPVEFEVPLDAKDFQQALTESLTKTLQGSQGNLLPLLQGFGGDNFDPADFGLGEGGLPGEGQVESLPAPAELPNLTPQQRQILEQYGL